MAKVRQDAWSHEDDLLLAETVLRHIREGSTQLNAFEEVGDKLNRTSAACGFRWNAEIRKNYVDAIELAKRQRKERKRALERKKKQPQYQLPTISEEQQQTTSGQTNYQDNGRMSFDSVIYFLKQIKEEYVSTTQNKLTYDLLKQENNKLKAEIEQLTKKLNVTEKQLTTIQEDYQTFIQIMDRARKMTVFDGEDTIKPPKFRMDKNGNLEQLANSSGN
ncbi:MAG TPA: RsfA family transcriptional regulator [Cerasibacillus sp.]|uniref:RsfA family transcriptional regulator n=1 Tax=Cerasibacillus sp. TaxID=2498711 RepID=UPI002F3E622A